ncbi:unnamed protein product, partial [Mesorhabditis belari]|uniref:Uncharacterized protein n=1 Tax=Mesorhabditis belari TaxID=2138241 RepID=A0AAF3FFB6_9BILA
MNARKWTVSAKCSTATSALCSFVGRVRIRNIINTRQWFFCKKRDLKKKRDKCTKLKTDFEMCSEEYIPHLRKYGAIIKELIQSLDEC